jgi:5'-3' exonuclease
MGIQSVKKECCLIIDLANMFYLCRTKRVNDSSINGGWPLIGEFLIKFNYWIKTHRPTSMIMLDEGYPHWRYSRLAEYKSGRDEVRQKDPLFEDFRRQRKSLKEKIKEFFPVYFLRNENLEADDLAYITAKYLRDIGYGGDIVAISSDADWLQLVTKIDNVKVWNPRTKLFTEKKDINYDFVLYKSLLGDKSDKIQGFPGVGPVTALKYVKNFNLLNEWFIKRTEEEQNRLANNKFLIDFKSIPQEYIDETINILKSIKPPRFDSTLLKMYCREKKAFRFLMGNWDEKVDNFLSLRQINFSGENNNDTNKSQ